MKLSWALLLTKTAYITYASIAVVTAGALWWHSQIKHAEERGALQAELRQSRIDAERKDSLNAILKDSLANVQQHTDTVRVYTQTAVSSYQRARAGVNLNAPQPAGVPEGSVIVPKAYVVAADSAIALVAQLIKANENERRISDARIAGLEAKDSLNTIRIKQLEALVELSKPKLSDKVKYAGVGGGIVAAVIMVLRK